MQRIRSFDLARGFTVLMIAPIHTVMLYSNQEVYKTILGYFMAFIAEGPGAQLFMLLMGVYFSFQRQRTWRETLKRSFLLFLSGLLLNVVKFVVPLWFGIMPPQMQIDLGVSNNCAGLWQSFLIGDILHFAAIALITLNAVRRSQNYYYLALFGAIMTLLAAPYLWDATSNNPFFNYLLQLLGGQPPHIFFPLLPWLVYPMVGLMISHDIQQYNVSVYPHLLKIGIGCILLGYIIHHFAGEQYAVSFYRTFPWDTVGHLGIVLVALYCWQWIETHTRSNNFFKLLTYCSRNITQLYIIQWMVIIWLLPFFGYRQLDYFTSVIAIMITCTGSFGISVGINLVRKDYRKKSQPKL